jgi:hypothetical protein
MLGKIAQIVSQSNPHMITQSKIVSCLASAPYGMKKQGMVYKIPHSSDILDNWYLTSSVGLDIIESVELRTTGNNVIHMSGRCMCVLNMLQMGYSYKSKTAHLLFPQLNIFLLPYCQISVNIKFYPCVERYIEEHTILAQLISPHITYCYDLTNIVLGYIGMEYDIGNVGLYAATTTLNTKERNIMPNLTSVIIRTYEITNIVQPGQTQISVNISETAMILKRIIMVFRECGKPNTQTLDILKKGTLCINNITHTVFTGDSAWEIDKRIFGAYVPDQPIYTITFDDGKNLMMGPERVSSYMNTNNTELTLNLTVMPNDFPVEVLIICECVDQLQTQGGMCFTTYKL